MSFLSGSGDRKGEGAYLSSSAGAASTVTAAAAAAAKSASSTSSSLRLRSSSSAPSGETVVNVGAKMGAYVWLPDAEYWFPEPGRGHCPTHCT